MNANTLFLQRQNEETNKLISEQCPCRTRAPYNFHHHAMRAHKNNSTGKLQFRIAIGFIFYRRVAF